MIKGWRLTSLLSAVVFCLSVPILFTGGIEEGSVRLFLRTTARCSVIFFLAAFTASALAKLFPGSFTGWLARNRRYIGVSFAFSHTLHLIGIILLLHLKPLAFASPAGRVTLIGGGIAFLLLYAMTATSFDRTAAWLGARRWKRLHKTGMYFFWFIFFVDYVPMAIRKPALYAPFATLVVAAFFLRIAAWSRTIRRSHSAHPQPREEG